MWPKTELGSGLSAYSISLVVVVEVLDRAVEMDLVGDFGRSVKNDADGVKNDE